MPPNHSNRSLRSANSSKGAVMHTTARTSHNAAPVKDFLVSLQYVSTTDSPLRVARRAEARTGSYSSAASCSSSNLYYFTVKLLLRKDGSDLVPSRAGRPLHALCPSSFAVYAPLQNGPQLVPLQSTAPLRNRLNRRLADAGHTKQQSVPPRCPHAANGIAEGQFRWRHK